jgi:O-antigen ligase
MQGEISLGQRMMSGAQKIWAVKAFSWEWGLFWCFAGVFLTMPTGTSPPLILGMLGVLVWLISGMAFRSGALIKERWLWPVIPFIVLPWIGLLYTPDPWGFGMDYARKSYYWLFCLALASLPFVRFQPRWLVNAFLLGLAVNAAVGILQLAGIIAPKQGWFSGLARGYNTLTVYLVLAILICAFCIRDSEGWKKRFLFIALASLYFFHLIIMEGRTGYLTFILLFPFMVKTLFRRFSAWKFALVFTVIVGAMYFSPFVKKRVDVTITQLRYHMTADPDKAWGREYTENQDRFYMWVGAIEVFLENPLIGAGTGGYPSALKEIRPPDDPVVAHPHNNILHMAASYGSIGVLAFLWLFGAMARNGWKAKDSLAGHVVLYTALVLFINGLFNTTVVDAGTILLLSLVVGLQRTLPQFSKANPLDQGKSV